MTKRQNKLNIIRLGIGRGRSEVVQVFLDFVIISREEKSGLNLNLIECHSYYSL